MQTIAELIQEHDIKPGRNWRGVARESDPADMAPTRLHDLDTTHPVMAQAVAAAHRWAGRVREDSDRAPTLILSGPNGTGKTHIARAILWSMTTVALDVDGRQIPGSKRPRGRFFHAAELLARLAPDDETGGRLQPVGAVIGSAALVIIDDVGAESIFAYVRGGYQEQERQVRYFRVIDWLYANNVPAVITTNLSPTELAAHVGRRAWDRLMQMAPAGQMISTEGVPSWRVMAGGR